MFGNSGIPLCFSCSGSWLRFPGSPSITMVKEALPLIPLSGIRAVVGSDARLTLELMLTLLGFLALPDFCTVRVGRQLIPLCGIKGVGRISERLIFTFNVDLASLPGPPGFLDGPWIQVHVGCIPGVDIAAWPYSVQLLDRFSAFLASLHWPSGGADVGHFGTSYLEVLILCDQWAGHRLLLSEKVTRPHVRAHRPIYVASVPPLCRLIRALGKLPGGLCRFLPCSVGSHLSRLRHLGWEQCSLDI